MKVIYEHDPRGSDRVVRGGSWRNLAQDCRAAFRVIVVPGSHNGTLGLRPLIRIRRLG